MTHQEEDIRLRMLNSFMTCPHRDTDRIKAVHQELREKDPDFYGHLGSWYFRKGDIRDHQEMFASMLITDPHLPNREVGLAAWREHAPFMKLKIHGYIEGKKVKIRTKTGRKIERDGKKIDEVKIDVKYVGLGKVPPMSFRKERERYLRWLEADNDRWDAVALRGFNALKSLYAGGRNGIKPCPRAQQILFDGKLPQDTKLDVFKKIAEAKPEEQAKLIVQNKIPYSVAVGLVEQITPAVYAALVNNMTPQQVIDNMASMESRGAMDNPELKALIEKKLERAAKSENVAALKSKTAVATGRIKDEAIIKKMENVADQQIKKAGTIKQRTHLYIDKSGSMSLSIEVGKRLSAMISGATENEFHAIAFDKMAREVVADAKTMSAWERAFSGIKANDGTSIGCALDFAIRKGWDADQIIVVTDEGENNSPLFVSVLPAFEAKVRTPATYRDRHSARRSESDLACIQHIPAECKGRVRAVPAGEWRLLRSAGPDDAGVQELKAGPPVRDHGYAADEEATVSWQGEEQDGSQAFRGGLKQLPKI